MMLQQGMLSDPEQCCGAWEEFEESFTTRWWVDEGSEEKDEHGN